MATPAVEVSKYITVTAPKVAAMAPGSRSLAMTSENEQA